MGMEPTQISQYTLYVYTVLATYLCNSKCQIIHRIDARGSEVTKIQHVNVNYNHDNKITYYWYVSYRQFGSQMLLLRDAE